MGRSVFVDRQLALITPRGDRHGLVVDRRVLQDYGYAVEEADEFKVGDLREYLFDCWDTIFSADGDSEEAPGAAAEVQLLHSGKRLDPNTTLAALDLDTSPVFHVLVKRADDGTAAAGSNRRVKNPVRLLHASRGKKPNEPVPEFAPTHVRSASRAEPVAVATATETVTTTASPRDEKKTPSLEGVTTTPQGVETPPPTRTTTSTRPAPASVPVPTPTSKDSCCTIM